MDIKESMQHMLQHADRVTERFYTVFLDKFPGIRPLFQGVNMAEQRMNLTSALILIERHHSGSSKPTQAYLHYLGTKHKDRGVKLADFPSFLEVLILTMKEFHGPDWSPELEAHWRLAINGACQAMAKGYTERFHV